MRRRNGVGGGRVVVATNPGSWMMGICLDFKQILSLERGREPEVFGGWVGCAVEG